MKVTIASHHLYLILFVFLAVTLVACERPLNEEETEPSLDAGLEEAEGPSHPAMRPVLLPTRGVISPTIGLESGEAELVETGSESDSALLGEGGEGSGSGLESESALSEESGEGESTQVQEQIHIVQSGDNLYRIGLQYGCTVEEIATYNAIANPHYIDVGQQIRIPGNCGG